MKALGTLNAGARPSRGGARGRNAGGARAARVPAAPPPASGPGT